ncbi:MAG: TlpA family protein disulfide reductase [Clostridia bacterium]|nr:TlpA family protein disulfide reductase [Clostridia bacterium]
MKKRILPVLIAAVIFCVTLTACSGNNATNGNVTQAGMFGAFESIDMEGNKVDYTALQGKKLTMVNVWATFCGPCVREMPDLEKISKEYAEKGLTIVGVPVDVIVNADGTYKNESLFADAQAVIGQTGVTYLNILMSESLLDSELGQVYTVPTTYFLDENGNQIGESYVGSKSYADWCSIIDEILAKM